MFCSIDSGCKPCPICNSKVGQLATTQFFASVDDPAAENVLFKASRHVLPMPGLSDFSVLWHLIGLCAGKAMPGSWSACDQSCECSLCFSCAQTLTSFTLAAGPYLMQTLHGDWLQGKLAQSIARSQKVTGVSVSCRLQASSVAFCASL